MVGYSGTALSAKLGVKPGTEIYAVDPPGDYRELLEPLPNGVRFVDRLSSDTDLVHVFSARREELEKRLRSWRKKLKPTADVWVSWPKKSAKVPTDITEDTVRELALPLGLVDVKVCAVTDVWSGLKLVIRRDLR